MAQQSTDYPATCHPTLGSIPAKRMGASTTVAGNKVYLFGGRLLSEHRVVSDLYSFDFQTFRWELIPPHPLDDVPEPRCFHSAVTWNNHLVIFGGRSSSQGSTTLFSDIRYFDLYSSRWLPPSSPASLTPLARYAHLASVSGRRMFVIGGQNLNDDYIKEISVYDLTSRTWERTLDVSMAFGTYRAAAAVSNMTVHLPGQSVSSTEPIGEADMEDQNSDKKSFIHLPYSTQNNEDNPGDIFLFRNANFNNVEQSFHSIRTENDGEFTFEDHTNHHSDQLPPGLRFPSAHVLGTDMLVFGTRVLEHGHHLYVVWAFDLQGEEWRPIDFGKALDFGSWSTSCLWSAKNKLYIFGNKNSDFAEDYKLRLSNWDHVVVFELEAVGVFQPPELRLDFHMQELGLAALKGQFFTDFDLICEDGQKIGCSRKLLEERWPWLKEEMKMIASPMPQRRTNNMADLHLTSRTLDLSQPYAMTLALLQYFYCLTLITPLQHAPLVLNRLLLLGTIYNIPHLVDLATQALHHALSPDTATGILEVSTICQCHNLRFRALAMLMSNADAAAVASRTSSLDMSALGVPWTYKDIESETEFGKNSPSMSSGLANSSSLEGVSYSVDEWISSLNSDDNSEESDISKSAKRLFSLKLPTTKVIPLPGRQSPAARVAKFEKKRQKKNEIASLAKDLSTQAVIKQESPTNKRHDKKVSEPKAIFGGLIM